MLQEGPPGGLSSSLSVYHHAKLSVSLTESDLCTQTSGPLRVALLDPHQPVTSWLCVSAWVHFSGLSAAYIVAMEPDISVLLWQDFQEQALEPTPIPETSYEALGAGGHRSAWGTWFETKGPLSVMNSTYEVGVCCVLPA